MVLLVRTLSPEADLTAAIRTRIAAIDGTVPLYGTTTVNEALDRFLIQRRFQTSLLGLFSGIALILAAVGIYGLIQYSVSQRTREIGVRMALGGTPQQVIALILRQGLSVALPGLALGMACALMLAEAVSALLFGVAAADLTNILITAGILLATTVVACYLPARRAAAILPMTALRR
jgi:putative ABC transport system permease protein